jgi:hypothetical protein
MCLWVCVGFDEVTYHNFIEQLVDQYKVGSNGFFGEHAAVVLEEHGEPQQKVDQ